MPKSKSAEVLGTSRLAGRPAFMAAEAVRRMPKDFMSLCDRKSCDRLGVRCLFPNRADTGWIMSLQPGEQRELAQIEDTLHKSDPKLAVTLAAFDRLAPRRLDGARTPVARRLVSLLLIRLRCLVLGAVAVFAVVLMALGITLR